MNFLAHLYLADGTTESVLGAVLGDFMRGVNRADLSDGVRRGVERHVRIDVYTDAHLVVARSRGRVSPRCRRYAGVLVDVFYDHFLARNWHEHSDLPLSEFVADVYRRLEGCREQMPERMRVAVERMIASDWLNSYASVDGIERALSRMSLRLTRENPLAEGAEELVAGYDGFEADFRAFFPDLRDYVAGLDVSG